MPSDQQAGRTSQKSAPRIALKSAGDWADDIVVENPGRISPRLARFVLRFLLPLVRLCHRPTLTGIGNLPPDRPFLLVANHSAGTAIAEIFSFYSLYLRDVGGDRPLAGFALPLGFRAPPVSILLRAGGAVPSTYDAARQTLAAGVPLLVFPGGDHEALRPIWQLHRVDFGGRTGFLRIAREAGVPVVPMGIRGSHMTSPVLFRSQLLAWLLVLPRLIGQKRWGVTAFGLIGSALILAGVDLALPWRLLLVYLWLGSPFIFLPFVPWRIDFRIGQPIAAEQLFPAGTGDEEQLRQALVKVQGAVQELVDGAAA